MGAKDLLILLLTHPMEARTLIQFKMYHDSKRDITRPKEHATTGWDRPTMRRCWEFLDMTSRSFAAVIKELDGDLARTVCLFYLVLRGLDTVEDDMTIPDEVKQPILRSFHEKTVTPGWNFNGNGPNEKDRQLLVEYENVVEEVNRLDPASRDIIIDICHKMEQGMADFAHKTQTTGSLYLEKIEDYDLYCHYVAGLVGEGLSALLSASGKEPEWLGEQLELSNHMGLMLQKTNIIRDYREDVDERRGFWPREIWGRPEYGGFAAIEDLRTPRLDAQGNDMRLWVISGMVLDVLRHATHCLDYLRVLKNQSTFNFCAIPQTMAMATLDLVFMNPEVFERNIKIRKAQAARLIMASTNPREVAYIFRDYARKIHAQASPQDPNFLKLSVACGKIEEWCERQYPSFIQIQTSSSGAPTTLAFDPSDARTRVQQLAEKQDRERELEARFGPRRADAGGEQMNNKEVMGFVGAAFAVVVVFSLGIAYAAVKVAETWG